MRAEGPSQGGGHAEVTGTLRSEAPGRLVRAPGVSGIGLVSVR